MKIGLCKSCGSVFYDYVEDKNICCKDSEIITELDDILFPIVNTLIKKGYNVLKTYRDIFKDTNGKIDVFSVYILIDRNGLGFDTFYELLHSAKKCNLDLFDVTDKEFKIGLNSVNGPFLFVLHYLFDTCKNLTIWSESLIPSVLKENVVMEGETEVEVLDAPLKLREEDCF